MRQSSRWLRSASWCALVAARAWAARGGRVVLVADSRRFSGWEAWWANVYNDSRLHFALLTVVIIPVLGWIVAKAAEQVMKRIGIDLESRTSGEN